MSPTEAGGRALEVVKMTTKEAAETGGNAAEIERAINQRMNQIRRGERNRP